MPKAKASAAVNDLFSGKAGKKKTKTTKSKDREQVEFPKELRSDADVMCAYRTVKDDLKKKGEVAEKRCEAFMKRWWCERFALTGKRPEMAHFNGDKSGLDFVVTRRISVTADKQDMLEAMGVDVSDYIETSGLAIDMDAVIRLGYMEKLQELIGEMVDDPAHVAEIFTPKVTAKEGLLEALPAIAEDSELDGSLADKIEAIIDVLKPTPQKKKPTVDGLDAVGCFKLVSESEVKKS